MNLKFVAVTSFSAVAVLCGLAVAQQPAAPAPLYNTAKAKLLAGKQIFSFTQIKFNPAEYCEKAKHYDFTWFEMQHSTLEFKDIEADDRRLPARRNARP